MPSDRSGRAKAIQAGIIGAVPPGVAIEAHPQLAELLGCTAPGVEVRHAAASDRSGEFTLSVPRAGPVPELSSVEYEDTASIRRVDQSFVRRLLWPRPRYINMVLFRPAVATGRLAGSPEPASP
jgi:hypothetical protein